MRGSRLIKLSPTDAAAAGIEARVGYLSHGETYEFEVPASRIQTAS